MSVHNSDEYEIVMSLYRDGKITSEQRDALIAALNEDDGADKKVGEKTDEVAPVGDKKKILFMTVGVENPYDASMLSNTVCGVSGVKSVHVDVKKARAVVKGRFDIDKVIAAAKAHGFTLKPVGADFGDDVVVGADDPYGDADDEDMKELDDELEELENEFDELENEFGERDDSGEFKCEFDKRDNSEDEQDNGPLYDAFCNLEDKLATEMGSIAESAKNLGLKIGHKVNKILSGIFVDDGVVYKSKPETYDVPYEDMIFSVKYVSDKVMEKYSVKCSDAQSLKERYKDILAKDAYAVLVDKIDNKFVGTHKYISGPVVLKIVVRPEEC